MTFEKYLLMSFGRVMTLKVIYPFEMVELINYVITLGLFFWSVH